MQSMMFEKPQAHPLKQVFRGKGVPYWQLARVFGTSETTVCRWLNGVAKVPADIEEGLMRLAKALDGKVGWRQQHYHN